jgi:hypothetical protein
MPVEIYEAPLSGELEVFVFGDDEPKVLGKFTWGPEILLPEVLHG